MVNMAQYKGSKIIEKMSESCSILVCDYERILCMLKECQAKVQKNLRIRQKMLRIIIKILMDKAVAYSREITTSIQSMIEHA